MRVARFALALLVLLAGMMAATACSYGGDDDSNLRDIVEHVPWTSPETYTYVLRDGKKDIGETRLMVERAGQNFALQSLSSNDQGNTDESTVTVDPQSVKPVSGTREIIDKDIRKLVETSYEPIEKDCDTKMVLRITQTNFKPPDEQTPDSTRRNPMCVPEHSYDNDTSLFLWRTISFEKGYKSMYKTLIANRRDKQTVTLHIRQQEQVETPAGTFDAWKLEIKAAGETQYAWFSTTDEHRLLAYQNRSVTFLLKQ